MKHMPSQNSLPQVLLTVWFGEESYSDSHFRMMRVHSVSIYLKKQMRLTISRFRLCKVLLTIYISEESYADSHFRILQILKGFFLSSDLVKNHSDSYFRNINLPLIHQVQSLSNLLRSWKARICWSQRWNAIRPTGQTRKEIYLKNGPILTNAAFLIRLRNNLRVLSLTSAINRIVLRGFISCLGRDHNFYFVKSDFLFFKKLIADDEFQGCGSRLIFYGSGSGIFAQSGSGSKLKQNFRRQFLSQIFWNQNLSQSKSKISV
jgi:hypothetical protein